MVHSSVIIFGFPRTKEGLRWTKPYRKLNFCVNLEIQNYKDSFYITPAPKVKLVSYKKTFQLEKTGNVIKI